MIFQTIQVFLFINELITNPFSDCLFDLKRTKNTEDCDKLFARTFDSEKKCCEK